MVFNSALGHDYSFRLLVSPVHSQHITSDLQAGQMAQHTVTKLLLLLIHGNLLQIDLPGILLRCVFRQDKLGDVLWHDQSLCQALCRPTPVLHGL